MKILRFIFFSRLKIIKFLSYRSWKPADNSMFSWEHKTQGNCLTFIVRLRVYAFYILQNACNPKLMMHINEEMFC
jgi:hypothetical protein